MVLFLLFSMPLVLLILNSFFNNSELRKRTLVMPFIIGLCLSIPFYLLYWSFFSSFFNNWTGSGLYFSLFLKKDGIALIYFSVVLGLILFLKKDKNISFLREITVYLTGMLFSLALYDVLLKENWYGLEQLLLLPLNRITVLLIVSIALNKLVRITTWHRWIWAAFVLAMPFLITLVQFLYAKNIIFVSVTTSGLFSLISLVLYYLESQGQLVRS